MTLIINELNPTTEFTRILNTVIFDQRLTVHEFRLWCQLAALPRGQKMTDMTAREIAAECGMNVDTCRDQRRALKNKGFLKGDGQRIIVTVPDADFQPKEVKLDKHQQLRHDLRDAWNKHKPDSYSKLRNPLAEKEVKTLTLHAKHNGETDLCKFLVAVLRGARADQWWGSAERTSFKFSNLFGTGSPEQKKFSNVEKLYKLSSSKKAEGALFDSKDDQCWLDWYHSKGHTHFTKVERLEMDYFDARNHETDDQGDENVIYIYFDEDNAMVHWTYKEMQRGVSYTPTAS